MDEWHDGISAIINGHASEVDDGSSSIVSAHNYLPQRHSLPLISLALHKSRGSSTTCSGQELTMAPKMIENGALPHSKPAFASHPQPPHSSLHSRPCSPHRVTARDTFTNSPSFSSSPPPATAFPAPHATTTTAQSSKGTSPAILMPASLSAVANTGPVWEMAFAQTKTPLS